MSDFQGAIRAFLCLLVVGNDPKNTMFSWSFYFAAKSCKNMQNIQKADFNYWWECVRSTLMLVKIYNNQVKFSLRFDRLSSYFILLLLDMSNIMISYVHKYYISAGSLKKALQNVMTIACWHLFEPKKEKRLRYTNLK